MRNSGLNLPDLGDIFVGVFRPILATLALWCFITAGAPVRSAYGVEPPKCLTNYGRTAQGIEADLKATLQKDMDELLAEATAHKPQPSPEAAKIQNAKGKPLVGPNGTITAVQNDGTEITKRIEQGMRSRIKANDKYVDIEKLDGIIAGKKKLYGADANPNWLDDWRKDLIKRMENGKDYPNINELFAYYSESSPAFANQLKLSQALERPVEIRNALFAQARQREVELRDKALKKLNPRNWGKPAEPTRANVGNVSRSDIPEFLQSGTMFVPGLAEDSAFLDFLRDSNVMKRKLRIPTRRAWNDQEFSDFFLNVSDGLFKATNPTPYAKAILELEKPLGQGDLNLLRAFSKRLQDRRKAHNSFLNMVRNEGAKTIPPEAMAKIKNEGMRKYILDSLQDLEKATDKTLYSKKLDDLIDVFLELGKGAWETGVFAFQACLTYHALKEEPPEALGLVSDKRIDIVQKDPGAAGIGLIDDDDEGVLVVGPQVIAANKKAIAQAEEKLKSEKDAPKIEALKATIAAKQKEIGEWEGRIKDVRKLQKNSDATASRSGPEIIVENNQRIAQANKEAREGKPSKNPVIVTAKATTKDLGKAFNECVGRSEKLDIRDDGTVTEWGPKIIASQKQIIARASAKLKTEQNASNRAVLEQAIADAEEEVQEWQTRLNYVKGLKEENADWQKRIDDAKKRE